MNSIRLQIESGEEGVSQYIGVCVDKIDYLEESHVTIPPEEEGGESTTDEFGVLHVGSKIIKLNATNLAIVKTAMGINS